MPEEPSKILSYATPPPPPPPLLMRDSVEYYREPPAMAEWTIGHGIIWFVGFVVLLIIVAHGLTRLFHYA